MIRDTGPPLLGPYICPLAIVTCQMVQCVIISESNTRYVAGDICQVMQDRLMGGIEIPGASTALIECAPIGYSCDTL